MNCAVITIITNILEFYKSNESKAHALCSLHNLINKLDIKKAYLIELVELEKIQL